MFLNWELVYIHDLTHLKILTNCLKNFELLRQEQRGILSPK